MALFSPLFAKIMSGLSLALILALAVMGWQLRTVTRERDELREYKIRVLIVTREASDNPKLSANNAPEQIRLLGVAINDVRKAQAEAHAKALESKVTREQQDRENKERADENLKATVPSARRLADRYARVNRVRKPASAAPRSDDSHADMPSPAFGAGEFEGAGGEADMVAISRADLYICTMNTERLANAVDWAKVR